MRRHTYILLRKFETHTWDIVALLGAFEESLSGDVRAAVQGWRERIIEFVVDGRAPCESW